MINFHAYGGDITTVFFNNIMKKSLYSIAIVAIFGSLLISCDETTSNTENTAQVKNNLDNSVQITTYTDQVEGGKTNIRLVAAVYEKGKVVSSDTVKLLDTKNNPIFVSVLEGKKISKTVASTDVKKDTTSVKKDSLNNNTKVVK